MIFEAKDGKYGEDGSETLDAFKIEKGQTIPTYSTFSNSLGDLEKNIEYLIGMERHSGSMDVITPLYVSRMLNVPLEEVEKVMKDMMTPFQKARLLNRIQLKERKSLLIKK